MWRQPKSVWAVAFACVIAFMGIGLVDPILKSIGDELGASPSQVSLLFTSYMVVMGLAMLVTGAVSSRLGAKKTLLIGLTIIIVGAGAGRDVRHGRRHHRLPRGVGPGQRPVHRHRPRHDRQRRQGLGRPGDRPVRGRPRHRHRGRPPHRRRCSARSPGAARSSASRPSWSSPWPPPPCCCRAPHGRARATSLAEPFRALRHRGLLVVALTALLYNFGFFTLLAFTPFPLAMGPRQIGFIFFGWGLLLAFTSVVVAPRLQRRFGTLPSALAALAGFSATLVVMAVFTDNKAVLATCVVVSRRLPRRQQHPRHRDGDEGRSGRAGRRRRRRTASSASAAAPSPRGWPASSARSSTRTCRSGSAPAPSPSPCACSPAADASSPTSTPSPATAPRPRTTRPRPRPSPSVTPERRRAAGPALRFRRAPPHPRPALCHAAARGGFPARASSRPTTTAPTS